MPTLSIIGTPIGNLEDITLRALRVLREADVVLCEDTRVTAQLLAKYKIKKPLLSYHSHSRLAKVEKIFEMLEEEKNLALVSDAGTPGISDPGSLLVSQVREKFGDSVNIIPIPGPSALIAALSGAGIVGNEFLFLGFLPHKKGRETLFKEISSTKRVVVFYESPHRILKSLQSLQTHCPKKKIIIARELTKVFEEFLWGNASELLEVFEKNPQKVRGEFVVLIAP
ncbi:16S rRNA (cytidine(1402)-2'-O)-methyltransferase [bacterium]|nr:16S rRNA (cytidine(1402)-2'-O)-methyltransferase [bacterium]